MQNYILWKRFEFYLIHISKIIFKYRLPYMDDLKDTCGFVQVEIKDFNAMSS